MRTPLVMALSAAAVSAQDTAVDVMSAMKVLSQAVTSLQESVATRDRTALAAPLDRLTRQVEELRSAAPAFGPDTEAGAWLGELDTAARRLREPVGDGAASDAFDLAALRRACTGCHLQVRPPGEERGLFPNRGNALFGTVRVEEQDGTVRDDRGGVVVFLEAEGLVSPPLPRKPLVSQKGRTFHPSVLTVTAGTTVRFPNDDVVFHNVFSRSRDNTFDLGIYGKGVENEHTFATTGLVKVHCNIHPDMAAHVLVLESTFAAVTSPSGFWVVPDVPDGDYTLRVWEALAEQQQQPVQVRGGVAVSVPLVVRETKPRVQHPNKHGRPYKKY